jgi:hypothetical protein
MTSIPAVRAWTTRHTRTKTAPLVPGTGASKAAPRIPTAVQADALSALSVVRIVSRGRTSEDPRAAEGMLLDALGARWPTGLSAKFVVTPGGFVHGSWPASWRGCSG